MAFPSLRDDGHIVELDLHGATIDEALRLAARTIREAHRRGRSSIRVIHGRSTSQLDPYAPSIKRAFYAELDRGAYSEVVTSVIRMDGAATLSLELGRAVDTRRMSILDVQ